jgi:hypothetical protein
MKVELVRYYIRSESSEFYTLKAPENKINYAIYLGEDEEHIWLHPLAVVTRLKEPIPQVAFLSVSRCIRSDVYLYKDADLKEFITNIPFGDMVYKGE